MKKRVYVTPRTECVRVIVEGTFAASVVKDDPQSGVTSTGHAIEDISGDTWNDDTDNANGWE